MAIGTDYKDTLLNYFEEEVAGESCFAGLAEHFDEPGAAENLVLLARVERCAAEATRPLLARNGLTPRTDEELAIAGRGHVARHEKKTWPEYVAYMLKQFPLYMPMFENLESMAPAEDLPALKILTEHEAAAIRFAEREKVGDPDASDELHAYIKACEGQFPVLVAAE